MSQGDMDQDIPVNMDLDKVGSSFVQPKQIRKSFKRSTMKKARSSEREPSSILKNQKQELPKINDLNFVKMEDRFTYIENEDNQFNKLEKREFLL